MGSDLQKLRLSLGGVETPCMGGDNLAVCLASLFEPGIESDELDDSGTWKQGAIDAMDQVLDAVHAHYAARIAELEAALSAATAERDAARHEKGETWAFYHAATARAETAEQSSAKYRDYAAEKSNQYVQNLHELEMLKADFNDCNSERARHKAAREAAEAEAARLREALQWYGEQAAGCRKITKEGDVARQNLDRDCGEKARAALGSRT